MTLIIFNDKNNKCKLNVEVFKILSKHFSANLLRHDHLLIEIIIYLQSTSPNNLQLDSITSSNGCQQLSIYESNNKAMKSSVAISINMTS